MTRQLFDLTGRIALVTGSSQGLGFTIARGLGEAGATLILDGRTEEKLQRAVAALSGAGLEVTRCAFDVSDARQVQEKIPALEKEVGSFHILVDNAGIQRRSPLEKVEEAVWREVLNTNLTAAFLCMKLEIRPGGVTGPGGSDGSRPRWGSRRRPTGEESGRKEPTGATLPVPARGVKRTLVGLGRTQSRPGTGPPPVNWRDHQRRGYRTGVRRSNRVRWHRLGPRNGRRALVGAGSRVPGANAECEMRNGY